MARIEMGAHFREQMKNDRITVEEVIDRVVLSADHPFTRAIFGKQEDRGAA
jgi:hypothetical protein